MLRVAHILILISLFWLNQLSAKDLIPENVQLPTKIEAFDQELRSNLKEIIEVSKKSQSESIKLCKTRALKIAQTMATQMGLKKTELDPAKVKQTEITNGDFSFRFRSQNSKSCVIYKIIVGRSSDPNMNQGISAQGSCAFNYFEQSKQKCKSSKEEVDTNLASAAH